MLIYACEKIGLIHHFWTVQKLALLKRRKKLKEEIHVRDSVLANKVLNREMN